jgi:hypothetical protein
MIARLIFDELRNDRRVAPIVAAVLLLLGLLAYFERGSSLRGAIFVPLSLLCFFCAIIVLCDLVVWFFGRDRPGLPWFALFGLVTLYLLGLATQDPRAALGFGVAVVSFSVVVLLYGRFRGL